MAIQPLEVRTLLAAAPIIAEVMAAGDNPLIDGDGDTSDWIELLNAGDATVDLTGWHLTDDPTQLTKWTFPGGSLDAGERMLVIASGKAAPEYVDFFGYQHTNFRLDAGGEYLALVEPGGLTIASQFFPTYPPQYDGVAFGVTEETVTTQLVAADGPVHALVPTDDSLGLSWTQPGFTPTAEWITESSPAVPAAFGVGFYTGGSTPQPNAHWPLDEPPGTNGTEAVIDVAAGHHGAAPLDASSRPTFGTPGATTATGTAAEFANTRIDVPYDPALNPASFTFAAWVKPTAGSGAFHSVVTSRHDVPNFHGFILYNDSGGNWAFWTGDGGGWAQLGGPVVDVNQWQHVAISFDAASGAKTLWVDGAPVADTNAQGYVPNALRDLHLGAGHDLGDDYHFAGQIDDAALWNVALDAAALADVMNLGAAAQPTDQVAHWPLDEPAGTAGPRAVVDATAGNHPGDVVATFAFGQTGATTGTATAALLADASIDVPYHAELNPQSFTLTAWVKPRTANGYQSIVTSRHDGPMFHGFILYNDNVGKWAFWTGDGGGWAQLVGPDVRVDQWQHLAVSFDAAGGTKTLWVDGDPVASTGVQGYVPNAVQDLHIGGGGDLGNEFRFDGLIDDVALFPSALDEATIEQIMADGAPASTEAFASLINLDVADAMHTVNASAYLRAPFSLADATGAEQLTLRIRYDDGFVAYLNGQEVARRNAPPTPAFNAAAASPRPGYLATFVEEIDLSEHLHVLLDGQNVLAIHGLNAAADDAEFLIAPELELSRSNVLVDQGVYLPEPTPGDVNSIGYPAVTLDEVAFSRAAGTFTTPLALEITSTATTGDIHFTLDGSLPDANSPIYDEPITIEATVQVRARVIEPGKAPGPVGSVGLVHLAADVVGFDSPLPILLIENYDAGDIPNRGWNQTGVGIVQVPRQAATMSLFGQPSLGGELDAPPDLSERIGIRVRGAFSSSFDNPGYSVEVWDERDRERAIEPLGMPAESDWVLYAPNPSYDTTMLSNTFIYELSNQTGNYAARTRFVEAFVHTDGGSLSMDDHVGVYVLMEKIKRDANRIDFDKLSPDGQRGGWMIDINRMDPQPIGGGQPQNFHTAGPDRVLQTPPNVQGVGDDHPRQDNAFFNFDSPGGYDINPTQRATIEDWFGEFEDALYGPDFADPLLGYAAYIDVDNFIDYFILHNITNNGDGLLISMWAYHDGPDGKLHMGPVWDYDLAYRGDPASNLWRNSTRLWYGRLWEDPEFQQRYVDRWQELRDGPLATSNMHAIVDAQAAEITDPVAVRHGIGNWATRLGDFKSYVATRAAAIDALFVARPTFDPTGGGVQSGQQVTLSAPQGTIYYTLDGSDPRTGAPQQYDGQPIVLGQTTTVTARAQSGGEWSGLAQASYVVNPAAAGDLAVTEIHYHPANPTPAESAINVAWTDDDFEFIELRNVSGATIDLTGVRFVDGLLFDFTGSEITTLATDEFVLLVRNSEAFAVRYGAQPSERIAGQYGGGLKNSGESVALIDAGGAILQQFTYSDDPPWPTAPDGGGPSLEIIRTDGDDDDPNTWYASPVAGGTPAAVAGAVIERMLFYNDSALDTVSDDDAIAPDKSVLLPGQTAGFHNYTSFHLGITGVMLDVANAPTTAALDGNDFLLAYGNDSNVAAWTAAPAPVVSVRPGEGRGGADRVVLTWNPGAIRNTWLQVTLPVDSLDAGLWADDVFYVGNAVGETGNTPSDALVTAADVIGLRDHTRGNGNRAAADSPHDINRDRFVNALDALLARNAATGPFDALRLLSV